MVKIWVMFFALANGPLYQEPFMEREECQAILKAMTATFKGSAGLCRPVLIETAKSQKQKIVF